MVAGNAKTYAIAVADQPAHGRTVTIASVDLKSPGWVVVHTYVKGAPGESIGASSLLPAGHHDDVVVKLDRTLKSGDKVMPVINIDKGKSSTYKDTSDNPPASIKGLVVVATIKIT